MESKTMISILSIFTLCCLLAASEQKFLLEHLTIMIFGMIVGLVSTFYLGENEDIALLEFNHESFFVVLAPPIFLEAGYNMNRKLFFDHSCSIFMLGIVGTYLNAILFAVCFYFFVSYVHPCGLMVGESFTFEDAIHLAALIAPTDVVAVLSIFKNIPSTESTISLISVAEGESLVNDGVGIVLFWHTGGSWPEELLPEDYRNIVGVILVPAIFFLSIIGGIFIAVLCAVTTAYSDLKGRPQVEFLVTLAFAYLSYFVFVPVPVVSEFISLFSCGFALAHFNEEHLSKETRVSTTLLFKSWGWVAETFIFFQIGVNTTVSLHDETWAWSACMPLLALVLTFMIILRAVVVFLTCTYLNCSGYDPPLNFKQQAVLNLASVRGAVSYALCLVWPNVANAESIHTTTLGVVLFTNFFFGSALGPCVRLLFPPDKKEISVPIPKTTTEIIVPGEDIKADRPKTKNDTLYGVPPQHFSTWGSWSAPVAIGGDEEEDLDVSTPYDDGMSWMARLDNAYVRPFLTRVRTLRFRALEQGERKVSDTDQNRDYRLLPPMPSDRERKHDRSKRHSS